MSKLAEDYLNDVRKGSEALRRKRDELERLVCMVESVTQDLTPRESCTVPMVREHTSDRIVALMDARDRYAADVQRVVEMRTECSGLLDRLENPTHARVLHDRYLMEMSWDEVARDMAYSYHHVHRLHSAALAKFQEVLDEM